MEIGLKHVHVGKAIDDRRKELGLSKTELGRKIGVPQQHVNRILERETMETIKLIKVCEALDFNFFSLFCSFPQQISAYLAAVAWGGDAHNSIGDAILASELKAEKANNQHLKETIKLQAERIEELKANLKDKDTIIRLTEGGATH